MIGKYFSPPEYHFLYIDILWREFIERGLDQPDAETLEKFEDFISYQLSDDIIRQLEEATREQSACQSWYSIRIGRMTASNIFEISRCQTTRGKNAQIT